MEGRHNINWEGTSLLPSGLIRAELSGARTQNLCKDTHMEPAFESFFDHGCQSEQTGGVCGLMSESTEFRKKKACGFFFNLFLCLGQEKRERGNPKTITHTAHT